MFYKIKKFQVESVAYLLNTSRLLIPELDKLPGKKDLVVGVDVKEADQVQQRILGEHLGHLVLSLPTPGMVSSILHQRLRTGLRLTEGGCNWQVVVATCDSGIP